MSGTTITSVRAWEALDSRGNPTVGCGVELEGGGTGRAIVPSGASTGSHEAYELRDACPDRFAGRGVRRALGAVVDKIAPIVKGMDAADRPDVDAAMVAADPDPQLTTLGGNAVLGVSLAVTLAAADAARQPLWRALSGQDEPLLPMPMINIISGGAHAAGAIDIQDVAVVPVGAGSFAQAVEWAWLVRAAAARLIEGAGGSSALVADEGGLAARLDSNEEALTLVTRAIDDAGLQPAAQVGIAVDLAATQFHDAGKYRLDRDRTTLDAQEWLETLANWSRKYPVVSMEDVLAEDDWASWKQATKTFDPTMQLLGDDLFATNAGRLQRGIEESVANAVLVKPNQAGTVTRAEQVVREAQAAGYATVVSARSGDTEDGWLADLAVGWQAGQIKVGSTTRSERTAKWNRLLEIEATAGDRVRYAWQR